MALQRWQTHASSDRVAVLDGDGAHTYRSLDERARALAFALGPLGGRRVAILQPPGARFVETLFGVLMAGGCAVVLSPLHPLPETRYFCEDADVLGVLVADEWASKIGELPRLIPGQHRPVTTPAPSDAAVQLYTSGTTGKPKGAIITHANLAAQQELLAEAWGWRDGDVLLHALPLHHLHGLGIAMLTALGAGATVRMLPHFDAVTVWEEMPRATVLMAVPTMYTRLLEAYDAASPEARERWAAGARALRLATSGSAALPVGLAHRWRAITGEIPLERYGMTEIGVGMSNPVAGERRAGTVGLPLRTVETRVVDDELWIKGPSLFAGYWRRADPFVEDGWFRTGDTVTKDEAGYYRILGRTSVDILKSGGYKLSALEIEEVLREHPAIREVAVVGLPDETWGERVVACIVPAPGRDAECAEEPLRAWTKERLAAYKVPRTIVLVAELPRNTVGKVVKPTLVARLRGQA
jgi:malonyl-CoA/methylmalonyl-CoA synthetase